MRIFLVLILLLWSSIANAEKRVALVIGNSAYQKASKLLNPANDARAIAGMLRAASFDEVTLYENLSIRELRQSIKDFADLARDGIVVRAIFGNYVCAVSGVLHAVR